MIAAFIVLLVLAAALGAFITVAELRYRNNVAVVPPVSVESDIAPGAEIKNEQPEPQDEPVVKEQALAPTVEQAATENVKNRYIVIKYSRSFLAKLIQSDEQVKRYYSELKNRLLAYKGVKSRISWKCETFYKGRKTLAKLRLRGKTLSICLALNPDEYNGTKYRVENLSEVKSLAATPCAYKVKTDRRLLYAKDLISELMQKSDLSEYSLTESTDYAAQYPYEDTDALIEKKLIKVLTDKDAQSGNTFEPRQSVTATEVDNIMSDEVAASLIEKSDGTTDRTKMGIVNIDTLSQYFEIGETVTLDEIKKRVKRFNKQTTYLKVLARGTLDKPLTVEADSFSIQAVKMIVLTGGKAIKKR